MLRLPFPLPRILTPPEIILGKGSINALRVIDSSKLFVLTSTSIYENVQLLTIIKKALGKIPSHIVPAPKGEPTLTSARRIADQLQRERPDWIVAIGGGSVLDAAKIGWVLYEHPDLSYETLTRPFAIPQLRGLSRFVAMPTTSGTGSEVSSAAAFHHDLGHGTSLVVSHYLLPDLVILDPNLAIDVPVATTIFSAFDALSHCVEGYISRFENSLLDALAESGIQTILGELPQIIETPNDLVARERLMGAATLAGLVQNQKIPGIGHAIAHQMGRVGLGHGQACALALNHTLRFNSERSGKVRLKLDLLARRLGYSDLTFFSDHLNKMKRDHVISRLPAHFKSCVSDAELIEAMTDNAILDPCIRANPIDVTRADLADLIKEVFNCE